ncbi:leucine-rich repeat-containing protein [Striga asiatica]|uniref:Leucine-rich repeat-containing protein n=1 Tax=Striga asiatica TaxID=4170 RepID=A0A5A7R452_STRAF|nr:leucine-rich repeat-containing protein [Striga asiatica]
MESDLSFSFSDVEQVGPSTEDERGNRVYKAVNRRTGGALLVKEFCSGYNPLKIAEIRREIEILKRLDHPNILKCYGAFDMGGGTIRLFLEDIGGGGRTLAGYNVPSEREVATVARQVLLGLRYLHEKGISHGDLKPSNIFVDFGKPTVKVLYLGKILAGDEVVGPQDTGAVHDEFSWDVWSVGLCILKLVRGSKVQKPSMALLGFLLSCMQAEEDVSNRWSVDDLLESSFLKQPYVVLPKLEFSASHASASTLSHKGEQISPKRKSSVTSMGVEQVPKEVKTSEDPLGIVPQILEICYLHCVMLLTDCEFEKNKLVQMWIAEECIEFDETEIMEDVATLYFNELVYQELVIPSSFDPLYEKMKYKVNSSKSPALFAEQGSYTRIGESDKIPREALHFVWDCKTHDQTMFDALKNLKQLRTLRVHCSVRIDHLLSDIFVALKLLRTLDLSHTHIFEIPGSIRLIEGLRYLDVSETPVKRLPQSIDCLYSLQTLNLRNCFGISALPKGLGRLTNLRHLDLNIIGQLEFMPIGMGNLVKLQTLQAFIVGKNDGCGIEELKSMNDITGSFCIFKLENVSSGEEARKAALCDKKRINKLELRWQVCSSSIEATQILECLKPHFSLKELQITQFGGLKLPSWITDPSYAHLASITLYKCMNCDILPSLGKLPSLKILHIVEMKSLAKIDTLFCRDSGGVQVLDPSVKVENAFSKLEKLTIENMSELEKWTGIEDGDFQCLSHISVRYCPKLYFLPSFSCLCSLQHLEINNCVKLLSLPKDSLPASLETLIIKGCPNINERCRKDGGGEDSIKIVEVKNVWIDFENISLN